LPAAAATTVHVGSVRLPPIRIGWEKPAMIRQLTPPALLLALAAALAACGASAGREVDKSKVATYQKGVTSCSQIRADLGQPLETSTDVDGAKQLTYGKTETTLNGATFVPIVGIFAGGAETDYDFVQIKCDAKDIYVEYKATKGKVNTDNLP
jgi:hypothetical protein